ncbi:MAG: hypothetical protein R2698_11065 [Microthrixaceae bacterium]
MPDAPVMPEVIVCVDCGGRCHRLDRPVPDPECADHVRDLPGDVVAYRCEDCRYRRYLVVPDPDDATGDHHGESLT